MKRITSKVTYRVPSWNYCNHQSVRNLSQPSTEVCRFCVPTSLGKGRTVHTCALHNETLGVAEGLLIHKCNACTRASAGYKDEIVETLKPIEDKVSPATNDIIIDPKVIIKMTLQKYSKCYNQLLKQGFPADMASQLAEKAVLEGASL